MTTYTVITSFESGDSISFTSSTNSFFIRSNYHYNFLLNADRFPDFQNLNYGVYTQISTGNKSSQEEYNNFKEYCETIMKKMKDNEEIISNILLKDEDGFVYLNIQKKDLVGVDFESMVQQDENNNKIAFKYLIFSKGE